MNKGAELLQNGKGRKHGTYDTTGIVCVDLKKLSGTAGIDVNFAYIYPDNKIDVVTESNCHYGYAHFGEDGRIYDNSNRSVFEVA